LSNVRDLEVGSTFLVPPHAGTYTPAPGDPAAAPTDPAPAEAVIAETPAPAETLPPPETAVPPTALPATITPFTLPTNPPTTEQAPPATVAIATADGNVLPPSFAETTVEAVQVAALPTQGTTFASATMQPRSGAPMWIIIALGVQVVIVVGAGIEFGRRALKKRK